MFSQKASDTVDFAMINELATQFECVCDRKQSDLICIECKRQMYGRLYQPCGRHPFVSMKMQCSFSMIFQFMTKIIIHGLF